jgi:hypothetical protein
MPIMVSKVADIINGRIVFSRFAKKGIKGVSALSFEGFAKSALFELHPDPRPRPPAEPHILRRRRSPPKPKSDLDLQDSRYAC